MIESKPEHAPLAGLRVVEMGQLIAGPFCGQVLADFGAEVIKVEDPAGGDPLRQWGQELAAGRSLWWPVLARNKKSVTCDLRKPAGQKLARQLIDQCDIVIENFRPGTLERWGLGYDELRKSNPGLILVRVTGYGQTGPYSARASFGAIGEAMGGLRYITGSPDRPPSRTGISLGDSLAGIFGVVGALLALESRRQTGAGQVVDVALYEAVLALMESLVPEYAVAGYTRERTGAILPKIAPSNVYPTRDGEMVLVAANKDSLFRRLAGVMNQPELADDPRFASHGARGENQAELDDLIAAWTSRESAAELLARLDAAAVPSGRVYRASDMLADPHFAARESIVRLWSKQFGELPMQNVFPRLSQTPGSIRWLGPELGEHDSAVYGELLQLGPEDLERLRRDGVIAPAGGSATRPSGMSGELTASNA